MCGMDSEIKNTIYLAVSCMLLALVLGFGMVMINIRGVMADARNEEVIGKTQMAEFQEFSSFDGKKLTGLQVVRLITEHGTNDVTVYVKEKDGVEYIYTRDDYYKNKEKYSIIGENEDISDSPLVKIHANTQEKASTACYKAYVVYNYEDVKSTPERMYSGYGTVTGIHVEYVGS